MRDKLAADLMVIFDGPVHSERATYRRSRCARNPDDGFDGLRSEVGRPQRQLRQLDSQSRLATRASPGDDEGFRGRVLIDGFYDGIAPLTPEEQKIVRDGADDSDRMLRAFGVARPETPGRTLQDAFQAPTFNIRGLVSAHVGAGARTIIPDRATAAIDVRLVKETPAAAMLEDPRAHQAAGLRARRRRSRRRGSREALEDRAAYRAWRRDECLS